MKWLARKDSMGHLFDDADAIYNWLVTDITYRGGTGRRTSRLFWDGPVNNEDRFMEAVRLLLSQRRVKLDHIPDFGWTYVVPLAPCGMELQKCDHPYHD